MLYTVFSETETISVVRDQKATETSPNVGSVTRSMVATLFHRENAYVLCVPDSLGELLSEVKFNAL